MEVVGIVGGIGPESTVEYYRLIVSSYLAGRKDGDYPRIIINSINMKKMLDLIGAQRLDEVTGYLVGEVNRLAAAGADFGLLASNTPHIVFDRIRKSCSLPLISIVECACAKARDMGYDRVGLFGTRFTMESGFYHAVFAEHGIEVIVPEGSDREFIHEKYMGELVKGIIRDETRKRLLDIAGALRKKYMIQGLILGGTELPLILKEPDANDIPFLDTTKIHVESILKRLLKT